MRKTPSKQSSEGYFRPYFAKTPATKESFRISNSFNTGARQIVSNRLSRVTRIDKNSYDVGQSTKTQSTSTKKILESSLDRKDFRRSEKELKSKEYADFQYRYMTSSAW